MKGLEKKFHSLSRISIDFFAWKYLPVLGILLLDLIFFYPVIFRNKVPLPVDALVGAHAPWTEVKWEGYPAGVPIKNQEITDSISQFFPWRSLVGEFWRVGKPPLWNQYMLSGAPLLASWHSASLYPLNVIYLLFSDTNSWTILVFLQIFLSGVFMYIFLYHLKLSKIASFFGSIAFSFSGYMIAWLEFATGGHAGLWLPLLLFVELNLFETKQIKWLILSSLVFFFIFTAGDFQVPFYITITYILFGFYISFRKKNNALRFKNIGLLFSGLIFGLLLSLPQLLPTIELYLKSVRVADPYIKEYFYGLMHWEKIVNFIWPDFFGNVVTRNYWGKFGYHEYLSFVGIIPLILAIFSLFRKKDGLEIFFWILLLLSLVFLFPTPIAFLPYKFSIPGLGTSSASRILFLVDFCLTVLAAYGFNKWRNSGRNILQQIGFYFLIVTFGVALGLMISLQLMSNAELVPEMATNLKVALKNMIPTTFIILGFCFVLLIPWIAKKFIGAFKKIPGFQPGDELNAHMPSSFKGNRGLKFAKDVINKEFSGYITKLVPLAILLLTLTELLRFAWKNTPFAPGKFVFPKTKIIEYLQSEKKPFRIAGGIPLNLFMPYKLDSAEGYDPLYPARNSEWYSLVNSGGFEALSGRYGLIHRFDSRLIDYANVLYVVDYKKNAQGAFSDFGKYNVGIDSGKYTSLFSEGRVEVFKNNDSLPRVWASTNYKIAKNDKELMDKIVGSKKREEVVILEEDPQTKLENKKISYSVENFKQGLNEISFNISLSDEAFVFLSESYDSGWEVKIDGNKQISLRTNYLFQSVLVGKGSHLVHFIYNPKSFRIGTWISASTLTFLIALLIFKKNSRKL